RDGPNGSLAGIARQDWGSKIVGRRNRIPEVAGWRVLCHKCPRATDWVHVGYRSGQATTLFPIATSWRSFVGCACRTGIQSLYGDKKTSVMFGRTESAVPHASELGFNFIASARALGRPANCC